MKKLSLLLLCVLLCFTGCGRADTLSGRIAHIYGATLLIAGEDGELYSATVGGADTGGTKLSAGQYITLTYREEIRETYPMQLGEIETIRITGEDSDLIEVFAEMIVELLAQNIQPTDTLGYDFGKIALLTPGEQQAVGYLLWTEQDAEPVFGTREELIKQGVILQNDAEEEYFPNGWLLSFEQKSEDTKSLDITLWRNDKMESAFFCELTETAGEWQYTLTEE